MTDYHSPTVVQPAIPRDALSPVEYLLLSRIFSVETHEDGLYFFAEMSPADQIVADAVELRDALCACTAYEGDAPAIVRELCPDLDGRDGEIELDLSTTSWEWLFQDMLKRTPHIPHVTVISAFTCTRMRPDGFGGMAAVITADAVLGKTTDDLVEDLLAQAAAQRCKPGDNRDHVLLRFTEAEVRAILAEVIASDADFAAVDPASVSDAEIRSACEHVVAMRDLREERGDAIFAAALHALRAAHRRIQRRG